MNGITRRNRPRTTQRIVDALEQVIDEWGLQDLKVNRIADKAGVSKVLIYRYFGSIDGLIEFYVKKGKLFPTFSSEALDQIRPAHQSDLARVWYRQVIQTYRSFRSSRISREILKASFVANDTTAQVTGQAVDEEMTRLVEQLSFVEGVDNKAMSAVILGAMSFLTIMAHNDRPMIGLDLRSEASWKRIEDAVKLLYIAVNRMTVASEEITLKEKVANPYASHWP